MPKRFSKISGMTICTCSAKGCPSEFRSCSLPQVIDLQLLAANWLVIEIEVPRTLHWERKDLCPGHRPTEGGRLINGRAWREKAIKGKVGSVSGHSRLAH
jgi:hypothetical protein